VNLQRAAQHGADAGNEFAGIKGLGNIVVGADFEAENAVHGFSAGGEKDDRNAGLGAEGLEKLKAGAAREHHVKDDHVVLAGEGGLETGAVVKDGIDLKALILEEALEKGDKALIVIDKEYAAHAVHFAGARGRWL
jgi:hypothetical protein